MFRLSFLSEIFWGVLNTIGFLYVALVFQDFSHRCSLTIRAFCSFQTLFSIETSTSLKEKRKPAAYSVRRRLGGGSVRQIGSMNDFKVPGGG